MRPENTVIEGIDFPTAAFRKTLPPPPDASTPRAMARDPVLELRNFIAAEAYYLSQLTCCTRVLDRLLAYAAVKNLLIVEKQNLFDIFSNLRDLKDFSMLLLEGLRAIDISASKESCLNVAYTLFESHYYRIQVYSVYLANLRCSTDLLEQLSTARHLNEFLRLEEDLSGFSLKDLLQIPSVRIDEYRDMMTFISDELALPSLLLDSSFRLLEHNVFNIQQLMRTCVIQEKSFSGTIGLVNGSRYIVETGSVSASYETSNAVGRRVKRTTIAGGTRTFKPKRYMLFLFNDLIVFAVPKSSKHFRLKRAFRMCDVSVRASEDNDSFFLGTRVGSEGELHIYPLEQSHETWIELIEKYALLSKMSPTLSRELPPIEEELKEARTLVPGVSGNDSWISCRTQTGVAFAYKQQTGDFRFELQEGSCYSCSNRSVSVEADTRLCMRHLAHDSLLLSKSDIAVSMLPFHSNPEQEGMSSRHASVVVDSELSHDGGEGVAREFRNSRASIFSKRPALADIAWNDTLEPCSSDEEVMEPISPLVTAPEQLLGIPDQRRITDIAQEGRRKSLLPPNTISAGSRLVKNARKSLVKTMKLQVPETMGDDWAPVTDKNGRIYFWNNITNETSWTWGDWKPVRSGDGRFYYWNMKTNAVTWNKPQRLQ